LKKFFNSFFDVRLCISLWKRFLHHCW